MSGALASIGFLTNLLSSSSPQRAILIPVSDSSGNTPPAPSGQQVYQALDGYVALEESHRDEMIMTDHPVEQGAVITDHAYRMPAELRLRLGWSAAMSGAGEISVFGVTLPTLAGLWGAGGFEGSQFLQSLYAELLGVMVSRELLTVYTGKRPYSNMLIRSITERTTEETENTLVLDIEMREIIFVTTTTVNVPPGMSQNQSSLANPQAASPTLNRGNQSLAPGNDFNAAGAAGLA
jgi:hypothetical protein